MARKAAPAKRKGIDESALSKGELRKLNALRKSLGPAIADKAFSEWLSKQPKEKAAPEDKVALTIADAVASALARKNMRMPRGGYLVKRGRGRVIVTPARS